MYMERVRMTKQVDIIDDVGLDYYTKDFLVLFLEL
jgi:hypothetical protein